MTSNQSRQREIVSVAIERQWPGVAALVVPRVKPHGTIMKTTPTIISLATILLLASAVALADQNDKQFDENLAKNATVVLRVHKFQTWQMKNKTDFTRYYVKVYQVFKNESDESFNRDLGVHAFKDRTGVPDGECTIYIGKYDVPSGRFDKINGTIWMLVGGDATNGVSHVDANAKLR